MAWFKGRALMGLVCAAALLGCDDGGGSDPAPDTTPDRGVGLTDDGVTPDMALEADAGAGDAVAPDAGGADSGPALPCDENSNYGLLAESAAPVDEGARYTPRAVWDGTSWGVVWLEPSGEPSLSAVMFGSFDRDGNPMGDATEVGFARSSNHRIATTGAGFAVAWQNSRTVAGGFDGTKLQLFASDGSAAGDAQEIAGTFDVDHLALGWAHGATGMLIYTRGRSGTGGLFALPVNEGGVPGNPVTLSEVRSQNPAVAYGDGGWGVAWLDYASEAPADLLFQVINDGGQGISTLRRQESARAQGAVHIAYGVGTFGVGWSKLDAMNTLKPFITLVDSAGDILATPPVFGPMGNGLVTDVAWLDPNNFGVVWQDTLTDGVTVGVSRVNTGGQVLGALSLAPPEGTQYRSMSLAGNVSRAGAWFTADPNPPLGGGFSDESRVELGLLGPCR